MFRRLLVEEWQAMLTIASFILFLSVFVLTFIRVVLMSRERVAHMQNLPLQEDTRHV